MSDVAQSWISLGLGGLLITLVGYSIWKLIGAWSTIAEAERDSSSDHSLRADGLQDRLNEEIKLRVALEVEVKFLRKELEEALLRIRHLEQIEMDRLNDPS